MKSKERKMLKYHRRKLRAFRLGQRAKAIKLSNLYYRYHFQVHGDHQSLWEAP